MTIFQAYTVLKNGAFLHSDFVEKIKQNWKEIHSHQWASLACLLQTREDEVSRDLLKWIVSKYPRFGVFILWGQSAQASELKDVQYAEFLFRLANGHLLGRQRIEWWISEVVASESTASALDYIAFCLMTSLLKGFTYSDLIDVTEAMAASGNIYDYRPLFKRCDRLLIRRYPTGALSEKAALILPSMIGALKDECSVATPFLVARSLSFTGGTWDKLSSIPGFVFPKPGNDAIRALKECGVAMTISGYDVNPADRILYQLRSATGTVESDDLIIASIASKQLCYPVDRLLLDIRFGVGAFLSNREHAEKVAAMIRQILEKRGILTCCMFTDTAKIHGASIGNSLEVLEAMAILEGNSKGWHSGALQEQRDLVCKLFATLLSETFPDRRWYEIGAEILTSGRAYNSFWSILESHCVSADLIGLLQENPESVLLDRVVKMPILSPCSGLFAAIDQKNLGYYVNFTLGGGGSRFSCSFNSQAGIRLNALPGDWICKGQPLCWVFHDPATQVDETEILNFFTIKGK